MIHVKDIMLGDWVKFPHGVDKIVDLPYIEGRGICASFAASATLFSVEVDKLKLIPLTAEILEHNKFECSLYNSAADGLGYRWIIYAGVPLFLVPSGKSWAVYAEGSDCPLTMIQYVHDLQHAFRLLRIDREVVL